MGSPTDVEGKKKNKKKSKCATQHISFMSSRRFGVELELNSFDGENRPPKGNTPTGIVEIAEIVANASPVEGCEVRAWEHTHNNRRWVAKPDSSCGLEICSPPSKGWKGLKDIITVVQALHRDQRVKSDSRCSVHVHVEVSDLTETQVAAIIAWWVKCEPVIMDAMPMQRKRNRYCQLIGMNNTFQHDKHYTDQELIKRVGDVKYYSMNTYVYLQGARKTLEFRTIEGAGCQDAYLLKQWIRFIVHFVECAVKIGRPHQYEEPKDDHERLTITPWTGLNWLDPQDVMTFLGFNNVPVAIPGHRKLTDYTLSKGMQQTRDWLMARLMRFMSKHKPGGMRYYACQQLDEILDRDKEQGRTLNPEVLLSPSELSEEQIFGDDYRF